MKKIDFFYPKNRVEWRAWLEQHHKPKQSVWLVFYTKASGRPSLTWREAVDIALCFGWIDSKKVNIDGESYRQFFSKRKSKSPWSKINKEKVQGLMENGLMAQAGLDSVEVAKQNGSWTLLDEVEELIIPRDLKRAFEKHEGSLDYFQNLSKSVKKMALHWIVMAKRPETRQKRINEVARKAGLNQKPKQF